MTHKDTLRSAIEKGMKKACGDMHSFCSNPAEKFNAEYLFTVATAHAINEYNGPSADPYIIRLEHSTKKFSRDCLPLMKSGSNPLRPGSSILRQKSVVDVTRHGRIDIAVYHDPPREAGSIPLCSIELKGFNPSKKLVLKDLRRNLQFHRGRGPTGQSLLKLSFFSAIHSRSPKNFFQNETEVKSQYEKWLLELGAINDLAIDIHTFTVSVNTQGEIVDEGDEEIINTLSVHHFIGAIVMFEGPN